MQDLENAHKSEIAKLERHNDKRMRVAEKTADKNLVDVTDEVAELKKCLKLAIQYKLYIIH